MRECTKCHETKPLTEYYKRSQSKDDGVQRKCKVCVDAAYKVYWKKTAYKQAEKRRQRKLEVSLQHIQSNLEKYFTFTI